MNHTAPIYAVRTESPDHQFEASHALIMAGTMEPPHRHRFRIRTELTGVPDASGCVVDFRLVDQILRTLCGTLDHRFLMPSVPEHGERGAQADNINYLDNIEKIYLPIPATSAEFLAHWVAESLRDGLRAADQRIPLRLRVELEESPGMYGICELPSDTNIDRSA